jgi:hypothetical protein
MENYMKNFIFTLTMVICSSMVYGQGIPLAEHPRPDFERAEWMNLNGQWAFTFDGAAAVNAIAGNTENGFEQKILVPFPWGSKLSGVEYTADKGDESKYNKGYYARSISIPEGWKGKRIFLVVGAADWDTQAWIDGRPLGRHRGGYTPFEFELTEAAKFGLPQNIFLSVDDTPSNQRLYGKQGYGDARGIWQTVYLEARGENYFEYIHFSPDIDRSTVRVEAKLKNLPAKKAKIIINFKNGEQAAYSYEIKGKAAKSQLQQFEIKLDGQHLWDLDDPYLYEIAATLVEGDKNSDEVNTYFGQRKISVANLPNSDYPYIALNNKPIYVQATLDQSYHPEGFYTFPSDDFMRDEILLSKRLGLNANRIHIKVEIPRKLYWADRLGLLIMADTPNFWGEPDEAARQDWEYCMRNQLQRDYNHPSIFAWVNFNETWGLFTTIDQKRAYRTETQEWVRKMYHETKAADPTRLVEDNSACNNDHVESDLNTWHGYFPGYRWRAVIEDAVKNTYPGSTWNYIGGNKQQAGVPMLNSECGNVWGYKGSTGDVDYTWDYHIMINEFRSHPLCAGWLYTEHHDVINEWNGYVRYDRSPKIDGLDELVPGMSLADFHSPYYIATQGELCRDANPGSKVEIPLFASFMTDKYPGILHLEIGLNGYDALGNEVARRLSPINLTFKPFMNESISPIVLEAPKETGVYTVGIQLKNSEGVVLGRNFALLRVKGGSKPDYAAKAEIVTFDPSKFSDAKWSLKQWNVLDKLKVNGAGSGYFEYSVPWPAGLKKADIESAVLVFEASAKELFTKDTEGIDSPGGVDYMLGGGAEHRSKNVNSYPMTDATLFPSYVKVTINGAVCGEQYLPDDPADHRGVLSWHSQPRDNTLHEAGSYGYLIKAIVPVEALAEGQALNVRIETPAGVNGGLAIYGKDFGRYPLDPTIIINKK